MLLCLINNNTLTIFRLAGKENYSLELSKISSYHPRFYLEVILLLGRRLGDLVSIINQSSQCSQLHRWLQFFSRHHILFSEEQG